MYYLFPIVVLLFYFLSNAILLFISVKKISKINSRIAYFISIFAIASMIFTIAFFTAFFFLYKNVWLQVS